MPNVLGATVNKRDFPKIHFYDQDFVDIYDKTWAWLNNFWVDPKTMENSPDGYFIYPEDADGKLVNTSIPGSGESVAKAEISQFESIFSSFFCV